MSQPRLDSAERRHEIVSAAVPLFARKGFTRTTTREIAGAAGVSEALVYKHFPSKAALYKEILQLACAGDPALDELATIEASTAGLVQMMRLMVQVWLSASLAGKDAEEIRSRHRLQVNSLLEDGEYARLLFEGIFDHAFAKFEACLRAADRAGDRVASPVSARNCFLFVQHVPAMIAYTQLPEHAVAPYQGKAVALMQQSLWFVLRGLGLKDSAIERYCQARSDLRTRPATGRKTTKAEIRSPL